MKNINIFALILILLTYLSFQQNNQPQPDINQYNSNQQATQSNIYLKLSHQQVMFRQIKQLLPSDDFPSSFITPSISQSYHIATHTRTRQICNIIRAPNYKPFRVLDRAGHKITNVSEWQQLEMQQSVIYKLQDMKKLQYALDIEAIDNKVVVIFQDGEVIFYEIASQNKIKQVQRKWVENNNITLSKGKIVASSNIGLFISSKQAILINATDCTVSILNNYIQTPSFYSAQLIRNQNTIHIYTANGNHGIAHYLLNQQTKQLKKVSNFTVTVNDYFISTNQNNVVAIVDIIQVSALVQHALGQQVFLLLNPKYGIIKITVPMLGAISTVRSVTTAMRRKNCRMMKLHNQLVYTSCPHIQIYNPKMDQLGQNPILMQIPIQLLSNGTDITFISHNSFQIMDSCTHATLQADFEGQTFHHTTVLKDCFVSVDDISVTLWKIRPPQYFLACKPNKKFFGKNQFNITINAPCTYGEQGCCPQNYKFNLVIYDNSEGTYIFEAVIGSILGSMILFALIALYAKRRKINLQYNKLIEQSEGKQKQNNISMINQTKQSNIMQTQEGILQNQKDGKKQLKILQQSALQ